MPVTAIDDRVAANGAEDGADGIREAESNIVSFQSASQSLEYASKTRLEGKASLLFTVPESLICDPSIGDRRLTVMTYLLSCCGMGGTANFSIDDMVEWSGRKSNRSANGINAKFSAAAKSLASAGYIEIIGKLSNFTVMSKAKVNHQLIKSKCDSERFAVIYLDELDRIMSYRNPDPHDRMMSNETVLLVFACLRMLIPRRRNRLLPEEEGVDSRRKSNPDAYDCRYSDIAEMTGLTERAVSMSVDVLESIDLIRSETLPRTEVDGKWSTNATVFCNSYKREGCFLLDEGREYWEREIGNKKRRLLKFLKGNGGKARRKTK